MSECNFYFPHMANGELLAYMITAKPLNKARVKVASFVVRKIVLKCNCKSVASNINIIGSC